MSRSMGDQQVAGKKARLTAPVAKICPICTRIYHHSPLVEQPTCGDPNCIRAARDQGKPFAVIPRPQPPSSPKTPRQKRHKKP